MMIKKSEKYILIGVCSFLSLGVFFSIGGFRINSTPSEPMGLWRNTNDVSKGSIVEACIPPTEVMIEAKKRGYLLSGKCRGDFAPVIKKIIAITGDKVTLSKDGVFVNGRRFSGQFIFNDSDGRILKPAFIGDYVLKSKEVFLASNYTEKSFDSRYFGVVKTDDILHGIKPVLTMSWKPKGY